MSQYGQYVILELEPSVEEVREAKKLLMVGARKTQEKLGKIRDFRWIVHRRWELIDPETYESLWVSAVCWKGSIKK